VAARGPSLCRTAFLLTGDWQAGEDLVQEALAKTYLRRRRLRDGAALEPYTRKVLLSLFLTACPGCAGGLASQCAGGSEPGR
jgi:DNA-directed RNA polymerase specialized sigma24 family protein